MTPSDAVSGDRSAGEILRNAESALKRFGYSRIPSISREATVQPEFWVQEAGVPRRTFPVFVASGAPVSPSDRVAEWIRGGHGGRQAAKRAIVVVPTDVAAEEEYAKIRRTGSSPIDPELSILVLPPRAASDEAPHWHEIVLAPKEVLRLATGVVVGLFRRAQSAEGSTQLDFSEMLEILRGRFRVDLARSLGVESDEDALFILYHLALRDAYAPGDPGANLHALVLRPTGPASRLPWFAA